MVQSLDCFLTITITITIARVSCVLYLSSIYTHVDTYIHGVEESKSDHKKGTHREFEIWRTQTANSCPIIIKKSSSKNNHVQAFPRTNQQQLALETKSYSSIGMGIDRGIGGMRLSPPCHTWCRWWEISKENYYICYVVVCFCLVPLRNVLSCIARTFVTWHVIISLRLHTKMTNEKTWVVN